MKCLHPRRRTKQRHDARGSEICSEFLEPFIADHKTNTTHMETKHTESFTIILTTIPYHEKVYSALLIADEKRHPLELHLEDQEHPSMIGQIHCGRVQKIIKGQQAAFVDIANGQTVYLPLKESEPILYLNKHSAGPDLHAGDEIAVQIVRDPIKTKFAAASTALSIHSENAVLISGAGRHGVSRKIKAERRVTLSQLLDTFSSNEYHFILRTSAESLTDDALRKELKQLSARYQKLASEISHHALFDVIDPNAPEWINRLMGIPAEEIKRIVTDLPDAVRQIQKSQEQFPRLSEYSSKLVIYTDDYPLRNLWSMDGLLKELTQKTVWLKSGGSIVIEQTEAMNVIDVNTAKTKYHGNKEALTLQLNREAAAECMRQIRLRNLSGVIMIDFINMQEEVNNADLTDYLRALVRTDSCRTDVIDMTPLGIVEITRQKKYPSLMEVLK